MKLAALFSLLISVPAFAQVSQNFDAPPAKIEPSEVEYKITGGTYFQNANGGVCSTRETKEGIIRICPRVNWVELEIEGRSRGELICKDHNVAGTAGSFNVEFDDASNNRHTNYYEFRKANPYRFDPIKDSACSEAKTILLTATPSNPVWITVDRNTSSVVKVRDR